MLNLLTKCLLFSLILHVSCTSDYKLLKRTNTDENCFEKIKPAPIETAWYDAAVDVQGNHISGLVLIKRLPASTRVVFTSETGFTFFDFEYQANGNFVVNRIVSKLDRKAVIKTLKEDFYLLLGLPFNSKDAIRWNAGLESYFTVQQGPETYYIVTDQNCSILKRLELGSKRKRRVTLTNVDNRDEKMMITHHTFDMNISLTKIHHDDNK
jgi:hypothetical protein